MYQQITGYLCGLLFALGLGISQMTRPPKILGFLNLLGDWDPTLLVVFAAATGTFWIGYQWILDEGVKKPLEQSLRKGKSIDRRLILGALIFGLGWGLVGLCPGPALTDLISFKPTIFAFVASMILGMYAARYLTEKREGQTESPPRG